MRKIEFNELIENKELDKSDLKKIIYKHISGEIYLTGHQLNIVIELKNKN